MKANVIGRSAEWTRLEECMSEKNAQLVIVYCIIPKNLADTSATPLVSLSLETPEYLDMAIAVRAQEPCTKSVQTFVDVAMEWMHRR